MFARIEASLAASEARSVTLPGPRGRRAVEFAVYAVVAFAIAAACRDSAADVVAREASLLVTPASASVAPAPHVLVEARR
jgi:hypothetical protein